MLFICALVRTASDQQRGVFSLMFNLKNELLFRHFKIQIALQVLA